MKSYQILLRQALSCLFIAIGIMVLGYGIIHSLSSEFAAAMLYPIGLEYTLKHYRPFFALISMVILVRLSLQSFDISIQRKIFIPLNTIFLISYFIHLILVSYLVSMNGFKPLLASAYLGLDAITFIAISDKVTLFWNKYFSLNRVT